MKEVIDEDSWILTAEEARKREFLEDDDYIHCSLCQNTDLDCRFWFYSSMLDNGRGDYVCKDCIDKIYNKFGEIKNE